MDPGPSGNSLAHPSSMEFNCQDLNELELPKTCKTEFPDVDDLLSFKLIIYPDEVLVFS